MNEEDTQEIEQVEAEEAETLEESTEELEEVDEVEEEPALVDVEIDGKTFQVPEEIKASVLRQNDYTQKTTALSNDREELAATRQRYLADQEFHQTNMAQSSQLHNLDSQLKEFEQVDWQTFHQQDSDQAQQLFYRYNQLKDQRQRTEQELTQHRAAFTSRKEQELASLTTKANEELTRDIKDWSPTKQVELSNFVQEQFGFTTADLKAVSGDPRLTKLMHMAQIGHKLSQPKTGKPLIPGKTVKTVTKLKGGKTASSTKQTDDMSIKDWMAIENNKKRG